MDELEQRLTALHEKGLNEDDIAQKASEAVAAARAKGRKTPSKHLYTFASQALMARI